ncbi:ABC transporter substrate-binding protein [Fusobacterium sp. PH5-44]|uniref:ABC transporter substrate-binding protein n=1 Tax=unclassified Fusobacterium TaxID=2648384 RepID=UPI003D239287
MKGIKGGLIAGISILMFLFTYTKESKAATNTEEITIGITQIVEHPALDDSRRGVIEALEKNGYGEGKVKIIYKNSQGDFGTAQMIGQEFNEKVDIGVAISTPSAQALVNTMKEKPVFFSVVTYPETSGILQKNVTGVSDRTPIEKQILLVKELLPNAKKIGTLYNTSEKNSSDTTEELKKLGKEKGYEVIATGITNINEISSALDILLNKIDVLYTSTDNMIASSYPLIVEKCKKKNIPIIGATKSFVDQGALASEAISEYEVGYQTGEMIIKYLNGEKVENIPYEIVKKSERLINNEVAKKFNIKN